MVYLSKRIGEAIKGHLNFIQLILQEYKAPDFGKCPPYFKDFLVGSKVQTYKYFSAFFS